MKKIMMFTAAGIIVFCIVSIATTQAMPRCAQGEDSLASGRPTAVLPVFNQRKIRDMVVELSNPVRRNNVPACDITVLHEKTNANDGRLMTARRAHVHDDQQKHLEKAEEPLPYFVDDDNNEDKEAKKNKDESAVEEKTDAPDEPVKEQEKEEKDTIEEYN